MENKLPRGYFFKNGVPTIENIKAWLIYFESGGTKDDKKVNLDAFKRVKEQMGWKSEDNGLLCFAWGINEKALNSKNTGEYARSMIETKNLSWEIKKMINASLEVKHKEPPIDKLLVDRTIFLIDLVLYNNRLYSSGDIRYFFMKETNEGRKSLYFNYGKYIGRSAHDIVEEDINYMLTVVGKKSEVSDWVKSDLWDIIIPKLNQRKEELKKCV